MGGERLVRRLTSKELTKRIIKEKTENIALQCVNCRAMYEIKSKFSDGCICSSCGSPCKAIGFLSPAKAHKKAIHSTKPPSKKLYSVGHHINMGYIQSCGLCIIFQTVEAEINKRLQI